MGKILVLQDPDQRPPYPRSAIVGLALCALGLLVAGLGIRVLELRNRETLKKLDAATVQIKELEGKLRNTEASLASVRQLMATSVKIDFKKYSQPIHLRGDMIISMAGEID